MTYQNHREAATFGKPRQLMRGGAYLANAARGAFDGIGPHGLDRVNYDQLRFFFFERGQDIAQVGFSAQLHGCVAQTKACCAHAHLFAGFFARNINGFKSGLGKFCSRLQKQC